MTIIVPCALRFGHKAKSTHYKENTIMLKNVMQGLGLGWILRNEQNNGIWTSDVAYEMEYVSVGQVQ